MEAQRELQNQVAIVTGAGRGLGAQIAHTLAEAGARVAVNDLNPDRAEQVAEEIRAQGGMALGIAADVSNKFQCVHLIETTRQAWGRLDILVNNAAVRPVEPILKMDEWAWQRCLDVNLKGTFFMSQLAGRVMVDENSERGGCIINVGSTYDAAEAAQPGHAAYLASKAGLQGFAQACALEYAPHRIRVNTLLPGTLDPLAFAAGAARASGWPADVLEAVLILCGAAGQEITGSVVTFGPDGAN